jgi:hypothetical protein
VIESLTERTIKNSHQNGFAPRIAYVRRAFEEVLSKLGVAAWGGARILDWYKKQAA